MKIISCPVPEYGPGNCHGKHNRIGVSEQENNQEWAARSSINTIAEWAAVAAKKPSGRSA